MTTLAQRIREIRYKKGLGPDALAEKAEISRTALYQIECGKTEIPRAGTLRRIAQALEVPMDQLLGNRPLADLTETTASQPSRPNHEVHRAGLANGPDWAFGEDVATSDFPETKRLYAGADHKDDLTVMLEDLLESRYGDSIAQIIQETHKLLGMSRTATPLPRAYPDIRYRAPR